jgi:hypothetical protein
METGRVDRSGFPSLDPALSALISASIAPGSFFSHPTAMAASQMRSGKQLDDFRIKMRNKRLVDHRPAQGERQKPKLF